MFNQYRNLYPGEFFVVAADTAAGGGDYCAAQFISKNKIDVPMVFHSKNSATEMTNEMVQILNEIYDTTKVKPVIAYERNNGGVYELERLGTLNTQGKYRIYRMPRVGNIEHQEEVKMGWDTNSASRPAMLQQLKEAIDSHVLKIYDKETINELFSFITIQTSSLWKAQAEKGCHDDLVMSLAIAWQLYQSESPESGNQNLEQRQIYNELTRKGEHY